MQIGSTRMSRINLTVPMDCEVTMIYFFNLKRFLWLIIIISQDSR